MSSNLCVYRIEMHELICLLISYIFALCRYVLLVIVKASFFLFHSGPSSVSAHCDYLGAGYSISVVWIKPNGVWTQVEVNVSGQSHPVPANGEQSIQISGFQPARTYEVTVDTLSGHVRSSAPYVFLCDTDPRGESK